MNNREIKFRAWEKEMKEMITIHSIDFESKTVNLEGAWRIFSEIVLMQFTGLKDANGKEIYEGDILKWGNNETYETYEVIWENTGFHTKWNMGYGIYDIESLYSVEDFKIIGNVYENPSLLK